MSVSSFDFLTMSTGFSLSVVHEEFMKYTCEDMAQVIREGLETGETKDSFSHYLSGTSLAFESRGGILVCSLLDEERCLISTSMMTAKPSPVAREIYRELHDDMDAMPFELTREMPLEAFCAVALTDNAISRGDDVKFEARSTDLLQCVACAWLFGYCDEFLEVRVEPSPLVLQAREGAKKVSQTLDAIDAFLESGANMPYRDDLRALPSQVKRALLKNSAEGIKMSMKTEDKKKAVEERFARIDEMLRKPE